LLKYAWQPVIVKGIRVQYLEIELADVVLRRTSIAQAVKNRWFAPPQRTR
jgi:hypothetical protein